MVGEVEGYLWMWRRAMSKAAAADDGNGNGSKYVLLMIWCAAGVFY